MGHTFNRPDEAAMLRILERHPHSPEGAILRLAWLEGLSRSEITELRWDQVDSRTARSRWNPPRKPASGSGTFAVPSGTPMW